MPYPPLPALVPLLAAAALALPAQATVTATAEGATDTQAGSANANSANAAAVATQAGGVLSAGVVANGTGGFTGAHVGASGTGNVHYTVVGLIGEAPVTFHWEFNGSHVWDPDNTAFGGSAGVGIFNQAGVAYIHNVGWGVSFVDGPPNMGDFAGVLDSPIGVPPGGMAGPAGYFDAHVPGTPWTGIGTAAVDTVWTLSDGWSGTMNYGASLSLAGTVTATQGVRLLSASVANANQIAAGGAYLLLDDGSHLAINAAVPEPGTWAMLAAGLAAIGAVGRRRLRAA